MTDLSSLPHSLESEQGLLAQLMVDPRNIEMVADKVVADDFSHPSHWKIFTHICRFHEQGIRPSATVLADYLKDDPLFEPVGGAQAYLVDLVANAPLFNSAIDYVRTLKNHAYRRAIIGAGMEMARAATVYDIDTPPADILEAAEATLYALSDKTVAGETLTIDTVLSRSLDFIERARRGGRTGVPTGIGSLDKHLGLFQPGEVTIVPGRPGMGKTAFALTAALGAARAGYSTQIFSLEMEPAQLGFRLLARISGLPVGYQTHPEGMKEEHFIRLAQARAEMAKLPLFVDDAASLTVGQIITRMRRHKRQSGALDLVVIDYLGLIRSTDPRANRVHQLGEITKRLKGIAKEMKLHVMLLCQVNRSVEQREDKRPSKSDLRDSGEIEEDADIILAPYRPEYYLAKEEPTRKTGETDERFNDRYKQWEDMMQNMRGYAEILIQKFRQGQEGVIRCRFDGTRQFFHDKDDDNA